MSLANQKAGLRKQVLAQREALSADERAAISRLITEHILAMPEYQNATTVLGYMHFGSEFISELWVRQALADGKRLVLPRVNRHANELDLYRVDDLASQLAAGSWGIAEPLVERCERLIDLNEVEFALLPGVAFARNGARLGYGGGYYDKLLARINPHPVRVAAAFALQVVQNVPQETTDVEVEWLVTERETIRCSAR
ncbi:MAG: 5-formyltetrahydrofolate cyclo-ligase [Gallionella sp.]|nr:5-formyltetrahydrofolate cyclo-ligase [Gallionella sp.]